MSFKSIMTFEHGPEFWIKREYMRRKSKNPAYSLRAFSSDIGVSPSRLSQVLNGKRKISQKMAMKAFDHIGLSPQESQVYFQLLAHKSKSNLLGQTDTEKFLVDQKSFELISDPIHFAILSLAETANFKSDPDWIAKRLNSDVLTVRMAIENLIDLKYLKLSDRGLAVTHNGGVQTTDHRVNIALRESHKKQLERAINSLDHVSIEFRDLTSEFMAIDPSLLPEAKKIIRQFRKRLAKFLEAKRKTEVYQLSIQLVPLTQLNERN